jgi:hypothetical protein
MAFQLLTKRQTEMRQYSSQRQDTSESRSRAGKKASSLLKSIQFNHERSSLRENNPLNNFRNGFSSINELPIQPKLTIGAPNDEYEQEADRVAELVMRMPTTVGPNRPQIQRLCKECEEEELQAKTDGNPGQAAPQNISTGIHSLHNRGDALPKTTRQFFEPRFGQDFSQVRIHNDGQSHQLARSINARAFTYGNHIVFGKGQYHRTQIQAGFCLPMN